MGPGAGELAELERAIGSTTKKFKQIKKDNFTYSNWFSIHLSKLNKKDGAVAFDNDVSTYYGKCQSFFSSK